jgi:hypothetical protein
MPIRLVNGSGRTPCRQFENSLRQMGRTDKTAEGGANMARYIMEDDKYSKGPVVFDSYREMIDKIREMSKKKGKEFTDKNEKDLKYKVETLLE